MKHENLFMALPYYSYLWWPSRLVLLLVVFQAGRLGVDSKKKDQKNRPRAQSVKKTSPTDEKLR